MEHFYILLGLGALLLLAFILSVRRSLRSRFRLPYVVDTTLFTVSQRAFKAVLERAVGKEYRVYGRVRAADVIGLRARLSRREWERAQDRLEARCFDFLVCAPDTTAIACAVNLVPRSRLRKQLPRDRLDRICAAAGLPFVRVRESDVYCVAKIEELVYAAMQARWGVARDAEIPMEDAAAVLQGLSAVMLDQDEDRAGRATARRTKSPSQPTRPVPAPARVARGDPLPSRVEPRRESSMRARDDIDEGPTFRIGDALDDDRAARTRSL
ncbi:DUF2726 domain-containing protein [Thiocystis violascens]|uniref:DUF2726 domain-containing protein n=1 Tax=Thiocystis violascens (strain ATCC 17096 / DSM 198 / 6111) TaxID=765911 RepID=I3YBB5_THIV6|nr:DUF2726 domain-containing protein [Thiocystis violascens]AFL74283.1 Protein of unknown function (DUF2726) [Thiocystis violascens DSM 198]